MTERKHKWAKVIKAWADGKQIQRRLIGAHFWDDMDEHPYFDNTTLEWRVKPENIVIEGEITRNHYFNSGCFSIKPGSNNNIRLEFDPDTYKLVKAEVIEK